MAEIMIEFSMLYVRNPTQREFTSLRQLQRHAVGVAQRARIVLLSAAGWSVPAIATALDCYRRSVRRWIHAFSRAGFAGLLGKAIGPLAKRAHYRKRKSAPPEFQQLRL